MVGEQRRADPGGSLRSPGPEGFGRAADRHCCPGPDWALPACVQRVPRAVGQQWGLCGPALLPRGARAQPQAPGSAGPTALRHAHLKMLSKAEVTPGQPRRRGAARTRGSPSPSLLRPPSFALAPPGPEAGTELLRLCEHVRRAHTSQCVFLKRSSSKFRGFGLTLTRPHSWTLRPGALCRGSGCSPSLQPLAGRRWCGSPQSTRWGGALTSLLRAVPGEEVFPRRLWLLHPDATSKFILLVMWMLKCQNTGNSLSA